MTQVIQKSSNVGAAKIALALPPETLWTLFDAASASARRRSPAFPGEVAGRAARVRDVEADRAGDDVVRPRHLGVAAAARARLHVFATDGELQPAHAAQARSARRRARACIKPETARAVRAMLELAVQPGGTAPRAQVAGYRVAGKTGTAHKLEGRDYAEQVRLVVRRLRAGVATRASSSR